MRRKMTNLTNCGSGSVLSNPKEKKPRIHTKRSDRPKISTRIVRRTLPPMRR